MITNKESKETISLQLSNSSEKKIINKETGANMTERGWRKMTVCSAKSEKIVLKLSQWYFKYFTVPGGNHGCGSFKLKQTLDKLIKESANQTCIHQLGPRDASLCQKPEWQLGGVYLLAVSSTLMLFCSQTNCFLTPKKQEMEESDLCYFWPINRRCGCFHPVTVTQHRSSTTTTTTQY